MARHGGGRIAEGGASGKALEAQGIGGAQAKAILAPLDAQLARYHFARI